MTQTLTPLIAATGVCVLLAVGGCASVPPGPTVGELLAKGGHLMSKAEFSRQLPARIHAQWPNGRGEEELLLSADGKLTGTGTDYASKTTSAAEGTWTMADDGKFCTPRTWTAWGSSISPCWYVYIVGGDFYGALTPDPASATRKVSSVAKQNTPAK